MTDKQTVLEAVQRLPESASLDQITEELRIMSAIRSGREDLAAGRVKSHAEVEQLIRSGHKVRAGWDEAMRRMAQNGDDGLLRAR